MAFKPSDTCCTVPPVVSRGYYKKGEYLNIGGLKTYVAGPPSAKNAILVVYDIFGFSDQMIQGADILALSDTENGPYRVFIPDFLEGKPADVAWYPPTTDQHGKALEKFFNGIGNPNRTIPRIPNVVKAIRESHKSIESVFALGLCWGSKVITICSGVNSPFKAIALAHPAMIDPDDAEKITLPTLLLLSRDENPKDAEAFINKLTVPNHIETFSDQIHGWMAARANLDNPNVAEKYMKGYQDVLRFFAEPSEAVLKSETTFLTILWSFQTAESAEKLIDFARNVPLKAKKDGKYYILSAKAGTTQAPFPGRPSRAQGYNVITILEFESVDDVSYWSSTDPVHKELLDLIGEPKFKDTIVTLFTNSDKTFLEPKEVGA